jgi:3-hydroxyacyl-[acyl-carrier-protein] dehydratase
LERDRTNLEHDRPDCARPLDAVDTVESHPRGEGIAVVARKRVQAGDPYMPGHFPGFPVYPGVFVIESVRQAAMIAIARHRDAFADLSALRSARFYHPAVPPDDLEIDAHVTPAGEGWRLEATCASAGTRVATVSALIAPAAGRPGGAAAGTSRPGSGAGADARLLAHDEIRRLLPHRHPMLLLDRVEIGPDGRVVQGYKAISACEPCYASPSEAAGPERWAYPFSLLLESFGQAAAVGWLASGSGALGAGDTLLFGAARDCTIHAPVLPGDVLRHEVRLVRVVAGTALAEGEVWAGARLVATIGTVIAAIRPVGAAA